MGYGTHCEYSLFGKTHYKKTLSDTWHHFLEELFKRDPDGLRSCIKSSDWLETSNRFRHSGWKYGPSATAREVAQGLWARVDRCNRKNLEQECWALLRRLERPRSDFVIYGFRAESVPLNHPLYVALASECKRLQEVHEETCKALDEAEGVLRQALATVEAAGAFERKHRPIDAFLQVKDEFMKLAEKGSG